VCLAISTISSLVPQQNNQPAANGANEQAANGSGEQKKFMRISSRVTSSAFFLPF
jgi:hypothetical protein